MHHFFLIHPFILHFRMTRYVLFGHCPFPSSFTTAVMQRDGFLLPGKSNKKRRIGHLSKPAFS